MTIQLFARRWDCSCGGRCRVLTATLASIDMECIECQRVYRVAITAVEVVGRTA